MIICLIFSINVVPRPTNHQPTHRCTHPPYTHTSKTTPRSKEIAKRCERKRGTFFFLFALYICFSTCGWVGFFCSSSISSSSFFFFFPVIYFHTQPHMQSLSFTKLLYSFLKETRATTCRHWQQSGFTFYSHIHTYPSHLCCIYFFTFSLQIYVWDCVCV